MTEMTAIERRLLDDLDEVVRRAADEKFARELYRALTRNVWRRERQDEPLSPSFQRAEWLVNEWRRRHGEPPLALAQSGGEGEVDRTVEEQLAPRGWTHRPLHTGEHEPEHRGLGESPPPPGHGERMAPAGDSDERDRRAHEAAAAELRRTAGR